jgi:hypothetical protein
MVQYGNQKMIIEFKRIGELRCDLINTVNKLKKYWRSVCIRMVIITVPNPLQLKIKNSTPITYFKCWYSPIKKSHITYLLKFVAKTKPLLLNENFKAFYCAVVGI